MKSYKVSVSCRLTQESGWGLRANEDVLKRREHDILGAQPGSRCLALPRYNLITKRIDNMPKNLKIKILLPKIEKICL